MNRRQPSSPRLRRGKQKSEDRRQRSESPAWFSNTCLSPGPPPSQSLRAAEEFVAHFSLDDIKNHVDADMNSGIRSAELMIRVHRRASPSRRKAKWTFDAQ